MGGSLALQGRCKFFPIFKFRFLGIFCLYQKTIPVPQKHHNTKKLHEKNHSNTPYQLKTLLFIDFQWFMYFPLFFTNRKFPNHCFRTAINTRHLPVDAVYLAFAAFSSPRWKLYTERKIMAKTAWKYNCKKSSLDRLEFSPMIIQS